MKRLWIASALVIATMIPGARAVSALQTHATPTVAYTVQSGDTLWAIARHAGMTGDRRAAVDRLIELNHLRSAGLVAGQVLRLPKS